MEKKKVTTQIEIEALVGQAEKALGDFKRSFETTWAAGTPPKSLIKSWEGLKLQLASLKEIAEKEMVDSSDLAQANNDYNAISKTIRNLKIEFKAFSEEQKKALLSPTEQKAMKARTAAVEAYTKAMEKSEEVAKKRNLLLTQKGQARQKITQGKILKSDYETRLRNLEKTAPDEGDTEAWKKHNQIIKEVKDNIKAYTKEINSADQEITNIDQKLAKLKTPTEELDNLKQSLKKLGVEGIDSAENIDQIRKILKKLDKEALDKVTDSLKDAEKQLDSFGKEASSIKEEIDKGTSSIEKQNKALADQEAFENRIKQFLGMAGAVEVFRRTLQSAFATIQELDVAMTEMSVVTELNVGDYWKQLPEHTKRASDLGIAIRDVYEAETLYYQQGLKTNEVVALSNETLKMARIAGLSAEDATNKMTAALRGFNMELNETNAKNVSDVYSELAAITASDVNEISSAMTKTASIASSAGMEFETTAAFLSQIIETTRESAETAGTAMKTVIARFQELKKSPNEIGEVEGEIVDANAIETALRSVGVSLRDAQGQFRDLDDVFLELSSKWDSLDKNTQRYIATIAAGSRQQSRFIAMMSDYSRTQELVTAANNSAGASQKQYEKTLDSLESKMAKLKNAWDEFAMGILESDLVKLGVDVLTKFLEIVNKSTSAFDGLGSSIMKVLSIVAMFKIGQKIFEKLKQPLMQFGEKIKSSFFNIGEGAGKRFVEGFNQGLNKTKQQKTKAEYEQLNKELESYKNNEKKFGQESQQTWIKVNKGISQAGQAVTALGIGVSVVGGVLSSMGLEETGEAIINIGNAVTFVGGALMAIPPILTMISSHPIVAAIVGAIAIITISVISLVSFFEKNKPEKKLQRIADAAEQAGKGAEIATKAYESLNDSLNSLKDQYKNLEELRYGTEEWSKAVQNVNASVLELIDEYPELASLIESKEGVLTLDIDSTEAQEIIAKYRQSMVEAKGVEYGAKIQHSRAKADYKLDIIDDKVFEEFITEGKLAAQGEAMGNLFLKTVDRGIGGILIGGGVGAAIGAIGGAIGTEVIIAVAAKVLYSVYGIGAIIDAVDVAAGPADEVVTSGIGGGLAALGIGTLGAGVGGVIGALAGLVEGIIEYQSIVDMSEKRNQQNRDNVSTLAKAYAEGKVGASKNEIINFLEQENIATGKAAERMADTFLENEEVLRDYGQALIQTEAEQKAYYQAMATNAQQMINLAAYTQQQLDWMTNVVDEDLTKAYEEKSKKELEELGKNELKLAKQNYVARVYGENARIEGNKILDEKGETLREFVSEEDWLREMASANATIDAANAMTQIPDILNKSIKTFDSDLQDSVSRAFTGQDLTQEQLNNFEKAMGTLTYRDEQGEIAKDFEELTEGQKALWETRENYEASLDRDFSGVDAAWEKLSDKQKEVFGWDGTEETLEQAKEAYEATYTEIYDTQVQQFRKAKLQAEELSLGELSEKLTSEAAQGWVNGLTSLSFSETDLAGLNESLSTILSGLTLEQANAVMAQINAIDKMDVQAWKKLALTFEELGVSIPKDELQAFINKSIEVSGAIEKIDFTSLANSLYDTYALIEKIKNSSRKFSEEDYKAILTKDNTLSSSFVQMGEEYVYIGDSIQDLTKALEENTTATLQEANRQLKSRADMAQIISNESINYGSIEGMNEEQLLEYLTAISNILNLYKLDIADFGIEGLSKDTNFAAASIDQKRQWASALAIEGGKASLYDTNYAEALSKANIQRYIQNDAMYNAEMALKDTEFADEHQQALLVQAVQSGAVSEKAISDYRKAIEEGNTVDIEKIGKQIADSINAKLEDDTNRDQYENLVSRLTEALYDSQKKQIEKLDTVNNSINQAQSNLVSKIQNQIDQSRQARENEKTENNIRDLESRRALYAMQTDSSGALAKKELDMQIEEAKMEYQDSLVDQALQNIQDANEEASQQRERQINLMQAQLDYAKESGQLANEAAQIAKTSIEDIQNGVAPIETAMGRLLWNSEGGGLGALAKEKWVSDLTVAATAASNYFNLQSENENVTGSPQNTATPEIMEQIPEEAIPDAVGATTKDWLELVKEFITVKIPQFWTEYVKPLFSREFWKDAVNEMMYQIGLFVLETLPKLIYNTITMLNEFFRETLPEWKENIESFGHDIENNVEEWIHNLLDQIINFAEDLVKKAYRVGYEIGIVIGKGITPILEFFLPIFETIQEIKTKSQEMLEALVNGNGELVKTIGMEMLITTGQAVEEMVKRYEYLASMIAYYMAVGTATATNFLASIVLNSIRSIANLFLDGINNILDGIKRAVKGFDSTYLEALAPGASKVIKTILNVPQITLYDIKWLQPIPIPAEPIRPYKTGGLADFTGPAWLDGTKAKPEYVLNASQTERFFSLVDVLEDYDINSMNKKEAGNNYYEISINVEKLENDYDVEQLASKIRSMLYDDAIYRNVNAVGYIR